MPIIQCYIEQETHDRLSHAAIDLGRKVEELAESAIAEAALNDAKSRYQNGERAVGLRFTEAAIAKKAGIEVREV